MDAVALAVDLQAQHELDGPAVGVVGHHGRPVDQRHPLQPGQGQVDQDAQVAADPQRAIAGQQVSGVDGVDVLEDCLGFGAQALNRGKSEISIYSLTSCTTLIDHFINLGSSYLPHLAFDLEYSFHKNFLPIK